MGANNYRLKAFHLIDSLPQGGGAERALYFQLPPLRARDVDSRVFVLRRPRAGIHEQIEGMGFRVDVVPGTNLIQQAWEFRKVVRREEPDVVHATLFDSCVVSRLALFGLRTPLVNSVVSLTYDPVRRAYEGRNRWRDEVVRLIDATTIRRVNRIHALSTAVADDTVRSLKVKRSKIVLIPRGRERRSPEVVMSVRERIRTEMGIADDVPVIITVGRQDYAKDQPTLVRAFHRVLKQHPNAQLWLVGRSGTQTPEITSAIEELDKDNNVILFGHRDDAIDLLCAADVFVFPSVYEGLGSAVIEAMSIGIPVVVSNSPALVEVVEGLGTIVSAGQPSEIADGILSNLIGGTRNVLNREGRNSWTRIYSLDSVTSQWLEVYRDLALVRAGET